MRTFNIRQQGRRHSGIDTLRTLRRSAVALGVAALLSGPLHAQTPVAEAPPVDPALDLDTVVVTGIRGAVMRAQDIKQEAPQIIDSVTAEDIGALPDRSVTETLKRISGLTVTGFAARDDTDHFSAEGSGVMIRGLTFVRGELNGRDVFSANGGRGISFEEVPAEQSKWNGECFVFDNRVTVRHDLAPGSYDQCHACRHPISAQEKASAQYEEGVSCPRCYDSLPEKTRRRAEERQRQIHLARIRNQPHPIGLPQDQASPNARES